MSELTTVREAEQELEIQELKRRIFELSCERGCYPVRFSVNQPQIAPLAELPPQLRAVANLDSRHTERFGLEIIGETGGPPHKTKYRNAYYVARDELYGFRYGAEMLVKLHDRFIKQLAKELYRE